MVASANVSLLTLIKELALLKARYAIVGIGSIEYSLGNILMCCCKLEN